MGRANDPVYLQSFRYCDYRGLALLISTHFDEHGFACRLSRAGNFERYTKRRPRVRYRRGKSVQRMVMNLGFPISPAVMDMIRRQREFAEMTRTPFAALEGVRRAQEQLQAAFLPSLAFAKSVDAAMLQIREITRMDDMRRLQASMADAVEQMRSTYPAIELKGLLGGTINLSALAEQMRLQEVMTQQSLTGLLGRVVQELESRDAEAEDGNEIDLADLVEVSAQELAKLPPTVFTQRDVASWLFALFQIVFALWLSQGTDQEIAALRGEVTQGIARLEVGQDSTAALVTALASASLASVL